jgi:hypothetical protein
MKRIRLCIGIMAGCLTLVNSAGAAELSQGTTEQKCSVKLGIEVRTWFPKISGQETRDSKFDLHDDLGHTGKNVTNAKLTFAENKKWRGNYESYTFNGNNTALTEQSFGKQQFLAGDKLQSEKKLTYCNINYLPNYQKTSQANFSWLFGLKWYKVDSTVNSDKATANQSYRVFAPALGAHYEMGRTSSTLYYAEFSAAPDCGKGYSYDAELGFRHNLSANAAFSGGYRCLKVYANKNDENMKLSLYGPFMQFNCKL